MGDVQPLPKGMAVTVRGDLISEREWAQLGRHLELSDLETEIVKRVFLGKTDEEIARELSILPRTVRTQIEHVYREYGLSNRLQLVLHVLTSLRACWEQDEPPFL